MKHWLARHTLLIALLFIYQHIFGATVCPPGTTVLANALTAVSGVFFSCYVRAWVLFVFLNISFVKVLPKSIPYSAVCLFSLGLAYYSLCSVLCGFNRRPWLVFHASCFMLAWLTAFRSTVPPLRQPPVFFLPPPSACFLRLSWFCLISIDSSRQYTKNKFDGFRRRQFCFCTGYLVYFCQVLLSRLVPSLPGLLLSCLWRYRGTRWCIIYFTFFAIRPMPSHLSFCS